ncbi:nucleoside kinase [candidate division WOR-3 bacterium]|nr:nucleoside kinase [candidate division WOR-3 bacterium]
MTEKTKFSIKRGQIPFEVFKSSGLNLENVIACRLNGFPADLLLQVKDSFNVTPITASDTDWLRIYRNSMTFLLFRAVSEIFRNTRVVVNHSISSGYYYEIVSSVLPRADEITAIESRMKKIAENDEEIQREVISKEKAVKLFENKGRKDTAGLLKNYDRDEIVLYKSGPVFDFYNSPLAPKTGILKHFAVKSYPPGIVVQFPSANNPSKLGPWKEQKKLFKIYHEQRRWNQILDIINVRDLNQAIARGKGGEIIRVAEALHEKKLSAIADEVSHDRQKRVILISGPSSSGKTTFSRRLTIALQVNGLRSVTLSLDNYFVDREQTPLDEKGNPDYESPKTIQTDLFREQLLSLLNGKKVRVPKFDFTTGKKKVNSVETSIEPGHPIIIEGIHALNEDLTDMLEPEVKLKLYASPLTQVNMDDHNRVTTSDCRILRRIVRDSQFRGYSPTDTINRWQSISRGEGRWIYPYQETADIMFNTSLIYEIPALKRKAVEMLKTVKESEPAYMEAVRLLSILEFYSEMETDEIPFTSVLREFIGGSVFKY